MPADVSAGIRAAQGTEALHGKGQNVDADRTDVVPLVTAAQQGDERAWGEIVDRYTPLVVSVVLRYRLSPTELQDVAQTVWLRLIEHLGDLREPRALPMWLITTAKREALRPVTSLAVRVRPTDPQDEGWAGRFVVEDDQDADLVRDERHAALMEGFATLSPRQRELLMILSEDPPVRMPRSVAVRGFPSAPSAPPGHVPWHDCDRTPAVQRLGVAVGAEPSARARIMTERYDDDEALALELTEAAPEAGPHVDEVARRAKGAFTWRTIDEDLLTAELTFDSTQRAEPALTRGGRQWPGDGVLRRAAGPWRSRCWPIGWSASSLPAVQRAGRGGGRRRRGRGRARGRPRILRHLRRCRPVSSDSGARRRPPGWSPTGCACEPFRLRGR